MFKTSFHFSVVAAAALVLASCGGGDEGPKDEQITTDTLSETVRADITLIINSIPSPLDMTKDLSKAGYNYNNAAMNSASKSSGYSTKFQQAANLGGYGACLGYATSYGQSQDVIGYLAAIAKLAKAVGVESAFDENFMKELTANVGKSDTLDQMIDKVYRKAERNLRSNDRVATMALVFAGGWVEGLHIACETTGSKPRDEKKNGMLYDKIYTHVNALPYVIDLLDQYKNDADCVKMSKSLTELREVVDPLAKVASIQQEQAAKIKEALAPVRKSIVE